MEPRPTTDGAIGPNFAEERFSFLSRFCLSCRYNTPEAHEERSKSEQSYHGMYTYQSWQACKTTHGVTHMV